MKIRSKTAVHSASLKGTGKVQVQRDEVLHAFAEANICPAHVDFWVDVNDKIFLVTGVPTLQTKELYDECRNRDTDFRCDIAHYPDNFKDKPKISFVTFLRLPIPGCYPSGAITP